MSRRRLIRCLLLLLLIVELTLVVLLRSFGWDSTTASVRWIASFFAATLPLLMALLVLCRNGRQVSLRSLMIAMGLIAIFLFVAVMPITLAVKARRGSSALVEVGVELHTTSTLDEYYEELQLDASVRQSFMVPNVNLAAWMLPIAGNTLKAPGDRMIREAWLNSDDEIFEMCNRIEYFPNIEAVSIYGSRVTSRGLARFAANSNRFSNLEFLSVLNVTMPDGFLVSMQPLRALWLWAEGPSGSRFHLSSDQLIEIAELPELEVLMIHGYSVTDHDMEHLRECERLRHILLSRTKVTEVGVEALSTSIPNCRVVLK